MAYISNRGGLGRGHTAAAQDWSGHVVIADIKLALKFSLVHCTSILHCQLGIVYTVTTISILSAVLKQNLKDSNIRLNFLTKFSRVSAL